MGYISPPYGTILAVQVPHDFPSASGTPHDVPENATVPPNEQAAEPMAPTSSSAPLRVRRRNHKCEMCNNAYIRAEQARDCAYKHRREKAHECKGTCGVTGWYVSSSVSPKINSAPDYIVHGPPGRGNNLRSTLSVLRCALCGQLGVFPFLYGP